jgi:predicted ATPase/DNA-binding winged helix-turn-helix (wHTH) protein
LAEEDGVEGYRFGELEIHVRRRELRVRGAVVPLGGRAFDIVQTLVEASGAIVTKSDLIERIWPKIFVGDNALQVHIHAIRKALGVDRALLKTISGHGYRLLGDWAVQPSPGTPEPARPPPPAVDLSPAALPVAGSALVGRATAVQQLRELLSACRVVTLIGPGGIGKTRLALEVARVFCRDFNRVGSFVELVSLSDPGLVASTVANALGLPAPRDAAAVAHAIGDHPLLLVLDSCEHLVEAAAQLVEAIVHWCPGTTVLATSRELLRVAGEWAFEVPPLTVPEPDVSEPGEVMSHSAVQLFLARANALQGSDVTHDMTNLAAVVTICKQLDGIPLAIELAAVRAATLGLPGVVRRLDDRFALLTGGRRTALPRHRTLRAAMDWSYNLLADHEQRMLRAVAVFAAGFTAEAVAAVIGAAADARESVIETIASLVEKSLAYLDNAAAPARWKMLETTRIYALDALKSAGEYEPTARRQAEYFVEVLSGLGGDMLKPTSENVDAFLPELDNVRTALDWAFADGHDIAIGVKLTAAAIPLWLGLSLLVECRERVELALHCLAPDLTMTPQARLLLHCALVLSLMGTLALKHETEVALDRMLAIATELNDVDYQLQALWALWTCRANDCQFNDQQDRGAEAVAGKFLEVARFSTVPADVFVGERLMGTTLHYRGEQTEARRWLEDVLIRYVPPPQGQHLLRFHCHQAILARAMFARVLRVQGFADQAMEHAQASVAQAAESDHVLSLCYALAEAGCPVALMTGRLDLAAQAAARLVDVATRYRLNFWRCWGRCLEGTVMIQRHDTAEGVTVLRETLEMYRSAGWSMRFPMFLGQLAVGLSQFGRAGDALPFVEEALERSQRDGERWCEAELYRIKGRIVGGSAGATAIDDAKACFLAAIDVARKHGALFWELRAVMSLMRLPSDEAEAAEVRAMLAEVYGRFTEGFDTPDMVAARKLLGAAA